MSKDKTPGYYAIITAEVRYSDRISSSEKLFFAEITALTNKTGECWASNQYFADLYDVDSSTVSKWVGSLKENGFIKVRYLKEGKQIKERFISIIRGSENNQYPIENNQGGIEKMERPLLKKSQGGIEKTPKKNTTRSNNTRKTTTIPEALEITSKMRKVIQAWNETFDIVVEESNKNLLKHISQATQNFSTEELLQAIEYRSNASYYKEQKPELRDNPKSFFPYPETIQNDMKRTPYTTITYDKKCELEQQGTNKRFEIDEQEKDQQGQFKWRMYG